MEAVETAVRTLKEELAKLEQQREASLRTADHLATEIRRLRSAIATLQGDKPVRKRGRKKSLDKTQVAALAERVLLDAGPLKEQDLRERLGEQAEKEGKTKLGLHLTLRHVLKAPSFQQTAGRWHLPPVNGSRRS